MANLKFILKTIIDGLVIGLLAIGIFLGRPPNPKPASSYFYLLIVLITIVILMALYFIKYGKKENITGIFFVMITAIIEVLIIGIIFQETIESIIVAIFIVSPSVVIFDKLLD